MRLYTTLREMFVLKIVVMPQSWEKRTATQHSETVAEKYSPSDVLSYAVILFADERCLQ